MHPSQYEIQREVETLRDIRRRSTAGGPGALVLDPDLPNDPSHSPSQHSYWDPSGLSSDDKSTGDHGHGSDSGDPSSLFWVPARLHPEIAPAEFREFIKEHARTPTDASGSSDHPLFASSGSLGRKKSMLKREYKPSANDGVENEGQFVPLQRNKSRLIPNPGPQLTISDLQRLDELAEEASKSDDPTKLRTVLRRSLSMNVSPSVIDKMDDVPELDDEADVPIIVPRPGQVLRRSARTKIRKPGQSAAGGAHVFTSRSRRPSGNRSATIDSADSPLSDRSSLSNDGINQEEQPQVIRPESYSEESFIYDSYVREDPEDMIDVAPILVTSSPVHLDQPNFEYDPTPSPVPQLVSLQHPIPQQPYLSPPIVSSTSRTPSPDASLSEESQRWPPPRAQEALSIQPPPSPSPSLPERTEHRKEKDKKGLFGKWGGDKSSKKGSKDKEQREKEKEKDNASFFGSLFGGKKKQDDHASNGQGQGSGRDAAAALLSNNKTLKLQSTSPTPQGGLYARYPIHVERAIYRLSHIKLANPRRPLYEQVLISNLMFWYLGVINKAQNGGAQSPGSGDSNNLASPNTEKDRKEWERKEHEEREIAERERLEREQERERERERELKKDPKRGALTKTMQTGTPGMRKAEMPVRAPQYDMQSRVMEQEYGYKQPNIGLEPIMGTNWMSPVPAQYHPFPASPVQPQLQQPEEYYFPPGSPSSVPQLQQMPRSKSPARPGPLQLPPGAMPPVASDQSQAWNSPSPTAHLVSASPPQTQLAAYSNGPRSPRSPPPQNRYAPTLDNPVSGNPTRLSGRSLSATAVPQPQSNGKLRKGTSARAVMTGASKVFQQSNEEDVPLNLLQQKHRR